MPAKILNHPLVEYVHVTIKGQSLEMEKFKAEIRLLKGHCAKPVIPPNSNLEEAKKQSLKGAKKTF